MAEKKNIQPIVLKLEEGNYYWCSCGKSSKQPFCDGSHKGTDKTPVAFSISKEEAKKEHALCTCKKTNAVPFCDGSHLKTD